MGFEIGGDTVVLEFEEGAILAGATVRCRMDIPIRKFLQLQRAFGAVEGSEPDSIESAYRQFGDDCLKSWDIVRDGEAVPATGEGMLDLPLGAAQAVFSAWAAAVSGISGNSDAASTNGATPQAAPVRMTTRARRSRRSS